MSFYFLYFLIFWHLGPSWDKESAPPSTSLEDWPTHFPSSHMSCPHFPALVTPATGSRQWGGGAAPITWSRLRLFKLANPKPAQPALPIPSCKNRHQDFCPHFPVPPSASWRTLVLPQVTLPGVLCCCSWALRVSTPCITAISTCACLIYSLGTKPRHIFTHEKDKSVSQTVSLR